jgi:hypothetical protein
VSADTLLAFLLLAQGVMGGVDTLLNHEMIERLPYRVQARREIGLHSIREALYGTLFCGLAWQQWHGALALAIAGLLAAEVLVTASDEFVENRTRVLPNNERVLHVFLTLNLGLIIALMAPTLWDWASRPTGWAASDKGWISWALAALGTAAGAWSLRDLIAWRRLRMARFGS